MPESGAGHPDSPEPFISERLRDARDLALAALEEITPASTVGPAAGYLPEADGVVSLRFENRLAGYPGWYWTVTIAQVDDEDPTVLEAELLPGAGALLAPEWVPWAERLAEYRAHQAELAAAGADGAEASGDAESAAVGIDAPDDDDLDDDGLDDEGLDDDGLDDDGLDDAVDGALGARLHSGDLDGVDIDELDSPSAPDPEDELDPDPGPGPDDALDPEPDAGPDDALDPDDVD